MNVRSSIAALLLAFPGTASAGRQPFSELLDDEVVPARVAELQVAVNDRIGTPDGEDDETAIVWGAAFGVTPVVEVWLTSELAFAHADGSTAFTWYAGEVRWRLRRPGPPPAPLHPVPLLRLVVERGIEEQNLEGRLDLVVGTDLAPGLHSVVMAGTTVVSTGEEAQFQGGVGLTGSATESLRLGGELFTEVPFVPDPGPPSFALGPDASFTLGRYWITTGALAGVGRTRAYDVAVHLTWGVEF